MYASQCSAVQLSAVHLYMLLTQHVVLQARVVQYEVAATTASTDTAPGNNAARSPALPVCVAAKLDVTFRASLSPAQGLPDSSAVYPYSEGPLAEIRRTLVVRNSGPSTSVGDGVARVTLSANEQVVSAPNCTSDGVALACTYGVLAPNAGAYFAIVTRMRGASIVSSNAAVLPATATVGAGADSLEANADVAVYQGCDLSLAASPAPDIPVGTAGTLTVAITNRHPTTAANDVRTQWLIPQQLVVQNVTYTGPNGAVAQAACTQRADTAGERTVMTCVSSQPADSTLRIAVRVRADEGQAGEDAVVVGASIAGVGGGQDTKAYTAPYAPRTKAVQFRLATVSQADLLVTIEARDSIPLDKGRRGVAIGQPLAFVGLVRNVGTRVWLAAPPPPPPSGLCWI
jgi:hypothetical protein